MTIPILLVLSDFAYLILRLTVGAVILTIGVSKFRHTRFIGPLDIILGLMLLFGFFTPWAAALVALESLILILAGLFRRSAHESTRLFLILLVAAALLLITRGSGILSLDSFLTYGVWW